MGWSGKNGKVYKGATTRTSDSRYIASGDVTTALAEVTAWDAEGHSRLDVYGHSDSLGFEDTCSGTEGVTGTVALKVINVSTLLLPGKIYQLKLESAAITLTGLATLSAVPVSTQIDGGQAVSATYRFQSKGVWIYGAGTGSDGAA